VFVEPERWSYNCGGLEGQAFLPVRACGDEIKPDRQESVLLRRTTDEAPCFCGSARINRNATAERAIPERLEAARGSQYERRRSRRRGRHQVRRDGGRLPRNESQGRRLLESREHRFWKFHPQGNLQARKNDGPLGILWPDFWRQRSGGRRPIL